MKTLNNCLCCEEIYALQRHVWLWTEVWERFKAWWLLDNDTKRPPRPSVLQNVSFQWISRCHQGAPGHGQSSEHREKVWTCSCARGSCGQMEETNLPATHTILPAKCQMRGHSSGCHSISILYIRFCSFTAYSMLGPKPGDSQVFPL